MYKGKTVTVVLPTYKEKRSIKKTINEFYNTGFVDEIVVVNNNAEKGTDSEVLKTKAKIVYEKKQGYGYAFQKGILSSKSDYTVTCEPDGSFSPSDLEKFLVFAENFDVVLGSRTSLTPLTVAGMGYIRKYANLIEAKSIEILFSTNALTDVGCAFKLFKKSAIKKIHKKWKSNTPLFNTELILLIISSEIPFVEIPVMYYKRIGKSSVITSEFEAIKWAFKIQFFILYYWIKTKLKN